MATQRRLGGVDGLRGLAACIVVVHHAALSQGKFSQGYASGSSEHPVVSLFIDTPLRLLWAGTEAVHIFFILSGFALAWAVRGGGVSWERFSASRVVRLYLPVIASILVAWLTFQIVPRGGGGLGFWLDGAPREYTVKMMLTDATLVGGVSGGNTAFWSLSYEVLFSLALPAYVFLGHRLRAWSTILLIATVSGLGAYYDVGILRLMPMFLIGVLLANSIDTWKPPVERWTTSRAGKVAAPVVLVLIAIGIVPAALWRADHMPRLVETSLFLVSLTSSTALVVAAIGYEWFTRLLSSRIGRWLGAISFSLYLVHEPIIKAGAFAAPGSEMALGISILVSFAVAWAFYKAIERPVHIFSQRVRDGA